MSKDTNHSIIPAESIERKIFLIRGQKVMLDVDLAELYGVPTMALNQAVKRNLKRFPADFHFQLSKSEKEEVITICDNLRKLKFSPHLPHAFTEHGVAMLSSVLKSDRAIEVNIYIIRAFIKLRELMARDKDFSHKFAELEREQKLQNQHINKIYSLLDKLMDEPLKPLGPLGFVEKDS